MSLVSCNINISCLSTKTWWWHCKKMCIFMSFLTICLVANISRMIDPSYCIYKHKASFVVSYNSLNWSQIITNCFKVLRISLLSYHTRFWFNFIINTSKLEMYFKVYPELPVNDYNVFDLIFYHKYIKAMMDFKIYPEFSVNDGCVFFLEMFPHSRI